MATIKGTWRFNAKLTDPKFTAQIPLPLSLSPITITLTEAQAAELNVILAEYAPECGDIAPGDYTVGGSAAGITLYSSDDYYIYELYGWTAHAEPATAASMFLANMAFSAREIFHSLGTGAMKEQYRTIIITEETEVSLEFYTWLMANAQQITATVKYNGTTLANLCDNQMATLKCADTKMLHNIIVETIAASDSSTAAANIAPLLLAENGTFDTNSSVIITEVWDGGEQFTDAVFDFYDITLSYAKSKRLTVCATTHLLLADPACTVAFEGTLNGEELSFSMPISEMDVRANDEDGVTVFYNGVPILLWLNNAAATFTEDFEDQSVYIVDLWSLGAVGTLTITAPGKASVDGFMPVKALFPIDDTPAVVEPHAFDFALDSYFDRYHKVVTVKPVKTEELVIYPSTEDVEYTPAWGKFYRKVTAKANSITNMKILCGIYLDPIPKTEYVYGNVLDVSGSYIVRMYTNGETVRVNLLSTDIDGWSAVTSPGTYTMTVKYSENGVSTQTAYKINVAAP